MYRPGAHSARTPGSPPLVPDFCSSPPNPGSLPPPGAQRPDSPGLLPLRGAGWHRLGAGTLAGTVGRAGVGAPPTHGHAGTELWRRVCMASARAPAPMPQKGPRAGPPGDNATDRGLQAVPGQPRVTSPPAVPGRGWARHWAPSRGRFTGVRDAPAPQVGPARRRLTPTVHLRDARPGLRGPGCAGRVLGRKTRGPVAPRAAPTLPASQTGRPRKWAGRAGTAQGLRGLGCLSDSGGLALTLIAVPREGRAPAATS